MTPNLHSYSFNQFLTDAAKYEQQIKNPRSTAADIDNVVAFINGNPDWMNFLIENPKENREPVKGLSERLRQIGSAEGKEVAKMIDQSLARDVSLTRKVSLVKDAMKEILRHTGGDLRDPEMRRALANVSQTSKGMRQLSDEVRIELINEHLKFKDIGFKSAEEVVRFLINSPAKDRIKYVNFEGMCVNNEQFEKLINNCPNLQHIEIPWILFSSNPLKRLKHLLKLENLQALFIGQGRTLESDAESESDALKHLANLINLQSLNIEGCAQLERDGLKRLANLKNLQSLNIERCIESDAFNLSEIYGALITGKKLETLLNKLRNELS